eukprot:15442043-Alexandrium_andersonii.AAC.1
MAGVAAVWQKLWQHDHTSTADLLGPSLRHSSRRLEHDDQRAPGAPEGADSACDRAEQRRRDDSRDG